MKTPGLAAWLAWGAGASLAPAGASGVLQPYEPDAWTLHLWHLDEPAPPFRDAVPRGGADLLGLLNGATAGQESLPGLGRSVSTAGIAGGERGEPGLRGGLILAAPALADGMDDDVPVNFGIAGEDGAFTYEAIIKLDVLPEDSGQWAMSLVSMDNDEFGARIFNFRIESSGLLVFLPLQPEDGGAALAAIPTEGPHAINTSDWFHVAVSYDGREGAPNNTRLYWTCLGSDPGQAHAIGGGSLTADLVAAPADFAIGNEARTIHGNGEAEPLVGMIDEVRMSSIARHPSDYLFVPAEQRRGPLDAGPDDPASRPLSVGIEGMWLDGSRVENFSRPDLSLPPGLHRIDFAFGVPGEGFLRNPVRTRYRLRGVEERWIEGEEGMVMSWEILDAAGREISLLQFPFHGRSQGWRTGIEDSVFTRNRAPVHLPEDARRLRITLSSEPPDTTGTLAVDNIGLSWGGQTLDWWANPGFEEGAELLDPARVPDGWQRGGSAPAIARTLPNGDGVALALIDGDQAATGSWTCEQELPAIPAGGLTVVAAWDELYSIVGGNSHRASFLNVPAGEYVFEVVASTTGERSVATHASLSFAVRARLYERPSFWALMAALVVGSIALGVVADLRRRQTGNLAALKVRSALAEERSRIARDMHDDLGTRMTRLTMNAALAERDLARDPDAARRRLGTLSSIARDLVTSLDGLVWSIDPANDTLDKFADRLVRLADEVLEGSAVRCRREIPPVLPGWPMRAAARHHLFLAVKEALHNVLKHAGPCAVTLSLVLDDEKLVLGIVDDGRGFDLADVSRGNGLNNLIKRMEAIGGHCVIDSTPGQGSRVVLACPVAALRRNSPRNS